MPDLLLTAVVCYLGLGFIASFAVKTQDRIESGWPKGALFLIMLAYFVVVVLSWPKELIDEYL